MDILGYSIGAWLAVAAIITLGVFISAVLCIVLLVLHEYAHSLALSHFGIPQEKIVLGWPRIYSVSIYGIKHEIGLIPIMGYVYAPELLKATPSVKALVALAGPAGSVILGVFLLGLNWLFPNTFIAMAADGSFILALINMIPLPPMDGWWAFEFLLLKFGVSVNANMRRILLGAGISSVGLTVLALPNYLS